MMRKQTAALLLAVLLLPAVLAGCGAEAPSDPPAEDSRAAEDTGETGTAAALGSLASFTAGTLDGGTFTQDDVAGKDVTVVNFWSLTCSPCIAEMPDLASFAGALPDNVQVITVCLDGGGNPEAAAEVLEKAGFGGVTLISGDGDLAALCANLMYTPTTVFADSAGALVGDAVIGGQSDLSGTFLAAVNRVLAAGGKDEISLETQ